jgi:hypothetical protein
MIPLLFIFTFLAPIASVDGRLCGGARHGLLIPGICVRLRNSAAKSFLESCSFAQFAANKKARLFAEEPGLRVTAIFFHRTPSYC